MINGDKYKTPEERTNAFHEFCNSHPSCSDCAIYNMKGSRDPCAFIWLTLEDEEKLMSCPFCGFSNPYIHKDGERWIVDCGACGAEIYRATQESVIAAWNRRVK